MKANVLTDFGGTENLELQEMDKPTAGARQAVVKVHATSVNLADTGVRSGMFGAMMKTPTLLGFDVSGVIEELGEGVRGWQVGDEVYYAVEIMNGMGANAEYNLTDVSKLAHKPENLSHAEAAAVPVAGGTAYAGLITSADLRLGQRVLIHGAAGGVGHFAVQLARATGAYVFATCGGYDAEFVKSLGAHRVIDYREEDFVEVINSETDGAGVDAVLDAAGGQVAKSIQATALNGQIVTVTGAQGDLNAAMRRNVSVRFVHLEDAAEKLEALRVLFERDQLKPTVGATFSLEKVGEAHDLLERGGADIRGKIVIELT